MKPKATVTQKEPLYVAERDADGIAVTEECVHCGDRWSWTGVDGDALESWLGRMREAHESICAASGHPR